MTMSASEDAGPGEVEDARKLLAMMAVIRDLRTLDERAAVSSQHRAIDYSHCQVSLFCGDTDIGDQYRRFYASTPDGARAKAAAWIRGQK